MQVSLKDFYCRIPSDLGLMGNLVGDALNFIRNECRISDEIELFELKVIMNELVLNGIMHGNREDRKKSVKLHLALKEDDHIYITVEDEGPGYDYKQVIESCELSMKETGRGILIVRELSERLIFNNAGNRITVVKRVWH
jgi:serine/threonine-protein kinase RsbW